MYLLGFDIGSSSIKAALIDAKSGTPIKVTQYPELELDIISRQIGWAEQHPEIWWESVCQATKILLRESNIKPDSIKGIGIAYQMHGLVLIDQDLRVLRPSIIWCDSRAVEIGNQAFQSHGEDKCLDHYLNSPGNFTASKLKWVKDHEPEIYNKIYKVLLPGDYIAMKLTGEVKTTIPGLSEGIFWDFKENDIAHSLLDHLQLSENHIPDISETFEVQGTVSEAAAKMTGLSVGTPVTYRAGDQPNNAFSLGVYQPNEVAATGGTSGVVYGVVDQLIYDKDSRVNGFAHVNHTAKDPRIGLLLCINGAGIQYAWMKNQIARSGTTYNDMERMISSIPVGADGLRIIPFGNGSERMLLNQNPGAQVNNLQFNRHTRAHFYRAALEGIAFSFVFGFQVLKELGLRPQVIKVGNDNLFRSPVFSLTIANLLNCSIEVIKTTGAVGAAKASGIGAGLYSNLEEAIHTIETEKFYHPENTNGVFQQAFNAWSNDLKKLAGNLF